ncbi:MAG: hypothetical protein LPK00_07285 [Bacillaceae bacterium]|nr:hypothetical protein [Bacillaceae bacterium]
MVTAVVIPILILYFWWISVKEIKKQKKRWLSVSVIKEDSIIEGVIRSVTNKRERFYYHYFLHVTEIKLLHQSNIVLAQIKTPDTPEIKMPSLNGGDTVRLIGYWNENIFIVSRWERL